MSFGHLVVYPDQSISISNFLAFPIGYRFFGGWSTLNEYRFLSEHKIDLKDVYSHALRFKDPCERMIALFRALLLLTGIAAISNMASGLRLQTQNLPPFKQGETVPSQVVYVMERSGGDAKVRNYVRAGM